MVERYQTLFRRLFRSHAIAQRIITKMRYLRRPSMAEQYPPEQRALIVSRLITRGILPGGPVQVLRFLRTLARVPAAAWPQVVTDWIAGLAMRDYVRRHFGADPRRAERLVRKTAHWLRQRYLASSHPGLPAPLGETARAAAALLRHPAQPADRGPAGGSAGSGTGPAATARAVRTARLDLDPPPRAPPAAGGLVHLPCRPRRVQLTFCNDEPSDQRDRLAQTAGLSGSSSRVRRRGIQGATGGAVDPARTR